ncbi:lytic murein transglycosylase [Mesorhizobium sp. B2-4-9]|nr:lytic murein transglycosylase [Mesorhizobium sp. B2-5-2]TPL28157.1 lytic murein transglycosylase [Mesorhizobium sp. B2-4-7]TPL31966.1 lytic murein transglycosylase [Mesorhizobium sp. B2-4-9]TPL42075.1 lytic murein transglycosylase [Mesorhizobium sp. B2-4-5]TPM78111.1 lytic murein transglycosylase [Mesorhizobium sp. B2-1-6]TPN78368.1 lytic murein transglycosylase [Mesorhizobium sp. B1-1-2]
MQEWQRGSRGTPLWPAGHLPRKGGDWQRERPLMVFYADYWRRQQPISPLAGEMPGRAEGGAQAPHE